MKMPPRTSAAQDQGQSLFCLHLSPVPRKYLASSCPIHMVEWKEEKIKGKREGGKGGTRGGRSQAASVPFRGLRSESLAYRAANQC